MTLEIQLRLRDLSLRPIVSVAPDESLRTAAGRMRTGNISSLVVNQPDQPVSIITERDLSHALADDVTADTPVSELASPDPLTVAADATVTDAATLMLRDGVRHLVVTRGDRAIGVVSIRDVLGALLQTLTPDAVFVVVKRAWYDLPENWLG